MGRPVNFYGDRAVLAGWNISMLVCQGSTEPPGKILDDLVLLSLLRLTEDLLPAVQEPLTVELDPPTALPSMYSSRVRLRR